jgi:hypothetical protein
LSNVDLWQQQCFTAGGLGQCELQFTDSMEQVKKRIHQAGIGAAEGPVTALLPGEAALGGEDNEQRGSPDGGWVYTEPGLAVQDETARS